MGVAELVIAIAAVGLVLLWWSGSLDRALTTVDASSQAKVRRGSEASSGGRTVLGVAVSARTIAVARRELRYAAREPRRRAGWASTVVFGMVLPVLYVTGAILPGRALVYWVCVTALVVGLQNLNQLGLDGSALWLHVVTTTTRQDARRDMAGRNLAQLAIAVPVLAVTAVLIGALTGSWHSVVGAFGLSLAFYGAALAVGDGVSVLAPYSVPERGGAFAGPGPGRGCLVGLVSAAAMLVAVIACLPLVALLGVMIWLWPAGTALMALLGPAYGAGLLVIGVRFGADRFSGRMPELLAQVRRDSAA